MPAPLTSPADAKRLLFAGDCRFTLVSRKTGTRYTYRIAAAKPNPKYPHSRGWFASYLTGPDNGADYSYVGMLSAREGDVPTLRVTRASKVAADAAPVVAANWLLDTVRAADERRWAQMEVWHEDTCARCGRALTDPASIARRLGPKCAGYTE
jgi:hypothetical protein